MGRQKFRCEGKTKFYFEKVEGSGIDVEETDDSFDGGGKVGLLDLQSQIVVV